MKNTRLIALDMDGTLLNEQSTISEKDKEAVRQAVQAGTEVVIATGRQYTGLPLEELTRLGVHYAITVNGAAIYHLPEGECLFEDCMSAEFILPFVRTIQEKDVMLTIFIEGKSYSQSSKQYVLERMDIPEALRTTIRNNHILVDNLAEYLEGTGFSVQKGVANFYPCPDGTWKDREEVAELLSDESQMTAVCGGFHNLEFTKAGNSKGAAFRRLAHMLNIPMEETAACGDSENDLDIIQAAGIGIAMANASDDVKAAADFITLSNNECGVAHALRHLLKIEV